MPIQQFTAQNFRCLENIELDADPQYNLIYGRNASGKTSVLEAIAYLGRGKSFRGASTTDLIRHGEQEFVLFGQVEDGGRVAKVGVRNSHNGLERKKIPRNSSVIASTQLNQSPPLSHTHTTPPPRR